MAKFSIDTKIGFLVKDPAAKAIMEEYVPGMTTDPKLRMAYGMSFKAVASLPQLALSKEKQEEINVKLQALG